PFGIPRPENPVYPAVLYENFLLLLPVFKIHDIQSVLYLLVVVVNKLRLSIFIKSLHFPVQGIIIVISALFHIAVVVISNVLSMLPAHIKINSLAKFFVFIPSSFSAVQKPVFPVKLNLFLLGG